MCMLFGGGKEKKKGGGNIFFFSPIITNFVLLFLFPFSPLLPLTLFRMVQTWRTPGSCPPRGLTALKDPSVHETPFIPLFPFFNEIYRLIWVISNNLKYISKQSAQKDYKLFCCCCCKNMRGKRRTLASESTHQTIQTVFVGFFLLCGCWCSC